MKQLRGNDWLVAIVVDDLVGHDQPIKVAHRTQIVGAVAVGILLGGGRPDASRPDDAALYQNHVRELRAARVALPRDEVLAYVRRVQRGEKQDWQSVRVFDSPALPTKEQTWLLNAELRPVRATEYRHDPTRPPFAT